MFENLCTSCCCCSLSLQRSRSFPGFSLASSGLERRAFELGCFILCRFQTMKLAGRKLSTCASLFLPPHFKRTCDSNSTADTTRERNCISLASHIVHGPPLHHSFSGARWHPEPYPPVQIVSSAKRMKLCRTLGPNRRGQGAKNFSNSMRLNVCRWHCQRDGPSSFLCVHLEAIQCELSSSFVGESAPTNRPELAHCKSALP